MMTNRITWIDNLKFIAIILVVWGHFTMGCTELHDIIYSFHMPLFFLISGYLTSVKTDRKGFIFRNFKNLIIPYFIYSFIVILFRLLLRTLGGIMSYWDLIFDFLIGELFWFVVALFVMKIIFVFSYKSKFWFYVIPILLLLFHVLISNYELFFNHVEWDARGVARGLPFCLFYYFGYWLRTKSWNDSKFNIWFFIGSLILYSVLFYYFGCIETKKIFFIFDVLIFIFQGLSGSYIVFCFCLKLDKYLFFLIRNIVVTVSNGTLMIYGLQGILLVCFGYFVNKYLAISSTVFSVFFTGISSLMLCICFYYLILLANRYYPVLIGKSK
jgi:fucose 4-O-acetylase-like acetyltransferase